MNLFKLAIDVFTAAFEAIIIYQFCSKFLNARTTNNVVKLLIAMVGITANVLMSTFIQGQGYSIVVSFAIYLYYTFLFKDKFLKRFLVAVLIFALLFISEVVVGLIMTFFSGINIGAVQSNTLMYLEGVVLSRILIISILQILGINKKNEKPIFKSQVIIPLCFIPISSIFSFHIIMLILAQTGTPMNSMPVVLMTGLTMVSLLLNFYIFETMLKTQHAEDTLKNMEKQNKLQDGYYRELRSNLQQTNKTTHDIKNFMTALMSYIENNDSDKAQEKIADFYGNIPSIHQLETGNDAINALIHSKMKAIEDNKIIHDMSVIIPPKLSVDEIDLCILAGNALDNAIEACSQIEDISKRHMKLKVFGRNNQISFLLENTKNPGTPVNDRKFFKTTKSDSYKHGFGIENMRGIVNKYDGDIFFSETSDVFKVSILLPNEAKG